MIEHLYIHVPFCAAKCRYCGFYSVVGDEETHRRFAPLPGRELALRSPEPLRPLTLYMGGGTPGILEPEAFSALVRSLGQHCRFDALEEWTVELNPASVTPERIRTLRHVGVNRVSVGVQSLDDGILRTMGRTHDAECAVKALRLLRQSGFTSLGVDLIAGFPALSRQGWQRTLTDVLACSPTHVSVYALSVEPNTPLERDLGRGLQLPGDTAQLEALRQAEERLRAEGFERYEISNYARPGHACRHNLACWRGFDYLGLGPAAASRQGRIRRVNRPHLANYSRAIREQRRPPDRCEELTPEDDATERLVFGLRLAEGISPATFAETFPAAAPRVATWERQLAKLENHGIVKRIHAPRHLRWRLTPRGFEVADAAIRELL